PSAPARPSPRALTNCDFRAFSRVPRPFPPPPQPHQAAGAQKLSPLESESAASEPCIQAGGKEITRVFRARRYWMARIGPARRNDDYMVLDRLACGLRPVAQRRVSAKDQRHDPK